MRTWNHLRVSLPNFVHLFFRLTLAAVVQLYAMAVDKSANDAYWLFKKEYEKVLP